MKTSLKIKKPLVSVNWLCENLNATNLVVLNGTLPKVTAGKLNKKDENFQVPYARFFDLKKVFSIQGSQFPNTSLSAEDFQLKVRELGINKDSCIVVYDEHGIYSAPRVWWLFKTFGFDNIAVLDGGFPTWKQEGYPIENKQIKKYSLGNFSVQYNKNRLLETQQVFNSIENDKIQLIDARSSGRFNTTEPEPRVEVRGGRIPNSKNIPHANLVTNGKLKSNNQLKELFSQVNPKSKEMIFSCGSGITACVLALGATIAGYEKLSVYDGSWTEWGTLMHLPIEK